jgi:hypothetical protein
VRWLPARRTCWHQNQLFPRLCLRRLTTVFSMSMFCLSVTFLRLAHASATSLFRWAVFLFENFVQHKCEYMSIRFRFVLRSESQRASASTMSIHQVILSFQTCTWPSPSPPNQATRTRLTSKSTFLCTGPSLVVFFCYVLKFNPWTAEHAAAACSNPRLDLPACRLALFHVNKKTFVSLFCVLKIANSFGRGRQVHGCSR